MKKIFGFVMAALLVVGFIGCTDPNTGTGENASANESVNQVSVESPCVETWITYMLSDDESVLLIYDFDVDIYEDNVSYKLISKHNNINRWSDTSGTIINYIAVYKSGSDVCIDLCSGMDTDHYDDEFGYTGFNYYDDEYGHMVDSTYTRKNGTWYHEKGYEVDDIGLAISWQFNVAGWDDSSIEKIVDSQIVWEVLNVMRIYGYIS